MQPVSEVDEPNGSEAAYIEDGGDVSTNSIQEILEFSQREAERHNASNTSIINLGDENSRLVNEYDRESNDPSGDENQVVEDTEEESDDEEFTNPRAKIPRLHSNLDLKESNTKEEETKIIEVPEVDEETCPICFEPWTNSGIHRLVCLKCGHLFGEGCIERWVKTNPKCPQCNIPARKHDIRRIYARSIKVQDTAELDKALKDIETEKLLRKKAEINASETKLQYLQMSDELNAMTNKYKSLLQQINSGAIAQTSSFSSLSSTISSNGNSNLNFFLDKLINVTETAGCRVVSFSNRYSAILVSQPSNSRIFPGFGIKKINFLDYKVSQYIPVHSKMIRDMALNLNEDGIVLTCGLDKMIKMTNISSNTLIHSFTCQQPIWSCAYNLDNPIYFYAGLGNGQVLTFDKRKIDKHVEILNEESHNFSPVCSLQYVPKSSNSVVNVCGLLVTQLDRLCFFEQNEENEFKYHPLLLESNVMSCSFEPYSRKILVSTRPSQKYPNVRHLVYEFNKTQSDEDESILNLNLSHTFAGSNVQKMLAKSKLFMHNSELYGCAPDELNKTVVLWDVEKNTKCCSMPNQNDVLDICPILYDENSYICALTDKQLRVFRRS